jgi:hypothetical protein
VVDQDSVALARTIIDSNLYMTLATADRAGAPWASPVFYAPAGYAEFYWISAPEARHSQNLAQRPDVSIVIFDSRVPASTGQAVYMSATAEQLTGFDIKRGLEIYPGPPERGGRTLTPEQVRAPAAYRLYRATVSQHSILCPSVARPCPLHGSFADHRTHISP